jgi:head-tail adaptor
MVKEFNDWIFDEARKSGDHGIVKTTYGWHIMYYVDGSEEWQATIKNELQTEKSESAIEDATAKYKVTIDYDAINDINA